jgi:outer membrane immunogenic protein
MKLRATILAASLCGGASLSAQAADLPARVAPPMAPAYVAPPFSWTGFYIGGHVGGGWDNVGWTNPFSVLGTNTTNGRFLGGGQLGYNYQISSLVLGLEGDFTWMSGSTTATDVAAFTNNTAVNWTSTITGRVGYAIDRALLYGKGGVAFAHENDTVTDPVGNTATGATTRTGWTVGGGAEYAFDRNWSARIEYDYLGLGSQTINLNGPVLGAGAGTVNLNIQRAIAGVNFRF